MSDRGIATLTVDRGNSTLDCCLRTAAGRQRIRLDPTDSAAFDRFLGTAAPVRAIGLSVVPGGLDQVRDRLRERGVRLTIAGVDLPCPLRIAYDEPAQLGVDRWVAGFEARSRFGAALVVDCGTAVTFGFVARDGTYQPGPIGPGLSTMSHALASRAPNLPRFDDRPPTAFPPRGTLDAVRAGVGGGFAALVDEITGDFEAALGGIGVTRVVTGGDAERLLQLSALRWTHVEELIHDGLERLGGGSG